MMLRMSTGAYERLQKHLFMSTPEQLAFLYCSREPEGNGLRLKVECTHFVAGTDFVHQSEYHIELGEAVRPQIIKTAWDRDWCIVEAHSHRRSGASAAFSESDMYGFTEFVPHILWRLPNRPYIALVFTERNFDALVWTGSVEKPTGLEAIDFGAKRLHPTNITLYGQKRGAYNVKRKSL